jgi:hypothetical protein
LPNEQLGIEMRTRIRESAVYRSAVWAERKQDVLLISAFGAWALIIGMAPLFALRALLP